MSAAKRGWLAPSAENPRRLDNVPTATTPSNTRAIAIQVARLVAFCSAIFVVPRPHDVAQTVRPARRAGLKACTTGFETVSISPSSFHIGTYATPVIVA